MTEHPPEPVPNAPPEPQEETAPSIWRLGLGFFGIVFLLRAFLVGWGMFYAGKLPLLPAVICVVYFVCGFGLLRVRKWARTLTLFALPVLAINAMFIITISPQASHALPIAMLCLYCVLFIYLHIPPVRREFPSTRKPRPPRGYLTPPPRSVPLSLRLSTVLGDRFMIMCWTMPAFIFFGVGNTLKKYGFRVGPGMDPHTAVLWAATWLVFLGVMAYMVVRVARWKMERDLRLLEYGLLAQAALTSKKEVHFEHTLYRLKFTYLANGQEYHTLLDTTSPERLLDEAREPILYDPQHPRTSILLDDLPAHVVFDDQGVLRHRYSFMGYVYALYPVLILFGMVFWTVK